MAHSPGPAPDALDIVVAICTYNNAKILRMALERLEQQKTPSHLRWGVIVVNNNSTDETSNVVEDYRRRGCLYTVGLVSERQQGLSHARRRAVTATDAPLIAFVDDDCLLASDWVQEAAAFFRHHKRAGVAGGRVDLAWEQPPEPWLSSFTRSFAEQDHGLEPLHLPDRGVIRLVGAGLVCRRTALQDSGWLAGGVLVGRNGAALTAGDDIEMVLRIRHVGYEAWYTPSLRLQHFIPHRRMSKQYVRRLHRGFGRGTVALHFIATSQSPTTARVLHAIGYAGMELAKAAAVTVVRRQGEPEGIRRSVALFEALGLLEGAFHLLWSDRARVRRVVAASTGDRRI